MAKKIRPIAKSYLDDDNNTLTFFWKAKKIKLTLAGSADRKPETRWIGKMDRPNNQVIVRRYEEAHRFQNMNGFGFNRLLCDKMKEDAGCSFFYVKTKYGEFRVPVKELLKQGEHYHFKAQGFELQIFMSLEQLEKYKV